MQVIVDQWTPLFESLATKVSSAGRTQLLDKMIGEIYVSTLSNFSGEGGSGDMRPWPDELLQSEDYKRHVQRDFATLYRTEEERQWCFGSRWEGGTGAHLVESFQVNIGDNFGTLTNVSDYASNHQNGEGVPRRAFFPVDESGQLMPFMESRIFQLADAHFSI